MSKTVKILIWVLVAATGAFSLAAIALRRGEAISALWLVAAALCTYALGYRFYSKFIAAKVLTLDAMRATPAERLENGRDFIRTNKWVVFGHHFAPSPALGLWWGRCWLRSLVICPVLFGYSLAQCSADASRILSSWCARSAGTGNLWGRWRATKSARPRALWLLSR